jgi:hypothetical protein
VLNAPETLVSTLMSNLFRVHAAGDPLDLRCALARVEATIAALRIAREAAAMDKLDALLDCAEGISHALYPEEIYALMQPFDEEPLGEEDEEEEDEG